MSPDKHPVYYLFNKLAEYHNSLNLLHIHNDAYYDELRSDMLQKRIDSYFNKEKKVVLKARRSIIEENVKKESQENNSINVQEEINNQISQYKKDFFEQDENKIIKKQFDEEIQAILILKKQRDTVQDAKIKEKITQVKDNIIEYLQDPELFSYCSREDLHNPKIKDAHLKIKDQAQKIIGHILNDDLDHITLPVELRSTAQEYGSCFKIEEYKKLFIYVQLAIIFEESTDVDAVSRYAFNLIVTFGDAKSAIEYLLSYQGEQKIRIEQELGKHKLYPYVYRACQFSPLPSPSIEHKADYDILAFKDWRTLVHKKTADGIYMLDNNFRNALANAVSITIEIKKSNARVKCKNKIDREQKKREEGQQSIEDKIKNLKGGCNLYSVKIAMGKDIEIIKESYKEDILKRRKVVLTEQEDLFLLHFGKANSSGSVSDELDNISLDKDSIAYLVKHGMRFKVEEEFKRSAEHEKVYKSVDDCLKESGGFPSFEGYDSMIARQSAFKDNEEIIISFEDNIKKLKVELAQHYCHEVQLKSATVGQIEAFNLLSLSNNTNVFEQYLASKGIVDKWRKDFFNLDRSRAGQYIPNVMIDCATIDKSFTGFYLTKVNVQNIDEAVRAATFGKETGCCQSFSGEAGTPCAKHGLTSPYGGFYVIRKGDPKHPKVNDPLISQSWVWKDDETGICLDSIEVTGSRYGNLHDVNMISKTLDTLALCLISNPIYGITQVNTGSRSGISSEIGRNLSQHNLLVPKDYGDYRDSHKQNILAAKNAPYLLYSLPYADEQIKIFLNKIALDCKDAKTLAGLPEMKEFILFYVLNKEVNAVKRLMSNVLDKHSDLKPLIQDSIEKTETLQNMICFDQNEFRSEETFAKIKEYTKNASVQTIGADKNSLLAHACFLGCLDIASYLVEHNANLEYRDRKGKTALALVCSSKDKENLVEIARILLDKGAKVNSLSKHSVTPLMFAIENNLSLSMIELLYARGAKIKKDMLLTACEKGNIPLIQFLINQGAKLNKVAKKALWNFIQSNPNLDKKVEELINIFMQAGANIHDPYFAQLLFVPIENNNVKLLEFFIELNINLEQSDDRGYTPFLYACKNGSLDILNVLLKHNVKTDVKWDDYSTPLLVAIKAKNLTLIDRLIELTIDIKHSDMLDTAFSLAFRDKDKNLMRKLMSHGADAIITCDEKVKRNENLLSTYIQGVRYDKDKIDYEIIDILINAGAREVEGPVPPLSAAVLSENIELIQYLISKGFDVNKRSVKLSSNAGSALLNACLIGNKHIIKILFDNGATLEKHEEADVFEMIYKGQNKEIMDFLKNLQIEQKIKKENDILVKNKAAAEHSNLDQEATPEVPYEDVYEEEPVVVWHMPGQFEAPEYKTSSEDFEVINQAINPEVYQPFPLPIELLITYKSGKRPPPPPPPKAALSVESTVENPIQNASEDKAQYQTQFALATKAFEEKARKLEEVLQCRAAKNELLKEELKRGKPGS